MINIKNLIKKTDAVIIVALLAVALVVSLYNYMQPYGMDNYALIYIDGELIESQQLTEQIQTIDIKTQYGEMDIIIINKKLFVDSSTCVNKQCIKKGMIYKPNQSIYCYTNHVLIKLVDAAGLEEVNK